MCNHVDREMALIATGQKYGWWTTGPIDKAKFRKLLSLSMFYTIKNKKKNRLTYLIQLKGFVFNFFLFKQLLDLRAEWTGGLGEHHDLVVLDVLINHLDGRP